MRNVPRNGEPNVILDTLSDEDDVRPPPSLRRLDIVDPESDDERLNSITIEGRSSLFLAPPCMICVDVPAKRACLLPVPLPSLLASQTTGVSGHGNVCESSASLILKAMMIA